MIRQKLFFGGDVLKFLMNEISLRLVCLRYLVILCFD